MITPITRQELQAKIESCDEFYLVETLGETCFRHSHLPGAICLPPGATEQLAPTLLPHKNADIVLYCLDLECVASLDAARALEELGYTDLYEYEGGKQDWVEAGLPTEGQSHKHRKTAALK
ncbi:MAG: rhodanese-like domain-containing protein [Abditibacteriaceae bacterium]